MIKFSQFISEKNGLWNNIHKKRERIKKGSGERMRPPGSKGAPTAQNFKDASKNEDSDAVKAFLAKGGKIKKLPPAKAQGYHGKDDPGKDVAGVMDKPDTSRFKTQKKVKSMEGYYKDQEIRKQDQSAPFDNPKPVASAPAKDKFGNIIKNRARHLARKAAKSQTNELSTKTLGNYIQKASDASKHRGLPTRKVDNRYSGVARASKQLDKRP